MFTKALAERGEGDLAAEGVRTTSRVLARDSVGLPGQTHTQGTNFETEVVSILFYLVFNLYIVLVFTLTLQGVGSEGLHHLSCRT